MEEYIYCTTHTLVAVSLFFVILFFLSLFRFNFPKLHYFSNKDDKKRVPPTSMGWPFLGHTLLWFYYMAKSGPLGFLHNYILPYGEIVICNFLGRPTVVSVDPEFNKFVLQNEGRLFKASYFKSMHGILGKHSFISVTGDLHRQLHGIAVSVLNNEKLRSNFMAAIQDVFKQTMTKWEGREIVLHHECKRLVLNVMAKHLVNISTDIETHELYTLLTALLNGVISVPIQMLGCTAYAKGLKARRILSDKFYKLMDERRKYPCNDVLSKLVNQENLPNEIVVDLLLFMFVASFETSATTMTIAVHFLSHSHKALQQLTEEHEAIQKHRGEEKLQWEEYRQMKFTQCVVNETLRLSSIAVCLIRETTEDVTAKGYVIPKGWGVMTFLGAVHLNEKFYGDALTFDPWRWQAVDKEALLWKSYDILFSPFGGGRRLCPGADLARVAISLFLHYFVAKFRCEEHTNIGGRLLEKEESLSFLSLTWQEDCPFASVPRVRLLFADNYEELAFKHSKQVVLSGSLGNMNY